MLRSHRVDHMMLMFNENRQGKSISKYYNLENIDVKLVRPSQFTFHVSVVYRKKCPVLSLNLPVDLIIYIKTFLREQARIQATIHYPDNYPWISPIWSIDTVKTESTKFISKCLCTDLYNETYSNSWTIIPVIEQDLLNYLIWLTS